MFSNSYQIRIKTNTTEGKLGILTPASESDMPINWSCAWSNIWKKMDSDCQAIIKLGYQNQIWGLMRYGIYPYPGTAKFVEIEYLEANPISQGQRANRLVSPIGKWLIWYAIQAACSSCNISDNAPLLILVSVEKAFDYYRDIIEMEYVGATTLAPGEDGYAFRFTKKQAIAYSQKHEGQWGTGTIIETSTNNGG
ncbi:MAG: hypothetical protein HC787_02885 [Nostocaceae cyanobacterium CSU_2_110]|nr:hypothetical protein [Nostocaceae cyanobacterium CSU_2_110]